MTRVVRYDALVLSHFKLACLKLRRMTKHEVKHPYQYLYIEPVHLQWKKHQETVASVQLKARSLNELKSKKSLHKQLGEIEEFSGNGYLRVRHKYSKNKFRHLNSFTIITIIVSIRTAHSLLKMKMSL